MHANEKYLVGQFLTIVHVLRPVRGAWNSFSSCQQRKVKVLDGGRLDFQVQMEGSEQERSSSIVEQGLKYHSVTAVSPLQFQLSPSRAKPTPIQATVAWLSTLPGCVHPHMNIQLRFTYIEYASQSFLPSQVIYKMQIRQATTGGHYYSNRITRALCFRENRSVPRPRPPPQPPTPKLLAPLSLTFSSSPLHPPFEGFLPLQPLNSSELLVRAID